MNRKKKLRSEKPIDESFCETARKTTDFAVLIESEAKYRGFIENLSVMFYTAEPHPPYAPIYISPAFAQFGYPLADWNEKSDLWTRILHPEDREWVLEATAAAMRAGAETDYEYRIVASNGAVFWVRDRGSFTRDELGNPVCWQGIILDITERKLDEQRLQCSEKLYRTLAHCIPQTGVLFFDPDFRYTLADGNLIEKHGFSRKMFEGKTLWDVFPPEISQEWSDYYRRALGGETVSLEQETETGWFQTYVVPVKNECGEIFAGMVMWQDVTAQKMSENALRESERRYRALSEKSLGLICTHDLNGNLLSVNPAAAKSFGYASEELIGKPLQTLVPPDAARHFEHYLKMIATDGEFSGLFRILTKSGEERILRVSNILYQESGKPAFVLGNAQDITDLKRTEQELRALFAAMTDVIFILDKNGRYLKIAPTNPSLLCRPAEQLVGKTLADTFPNEQAQTFLDVTRRALETRQTQRIEYTLTISGSEVCFAATVAPLTSETVIFVARDVTEREHAEAALIESEARYRNLFENASDLIYVRDLAGNYLSINKATERVIGYTFEEATKINMRQVVAPEHLERARLMAIDEAAGINGTYELDCLTKNGSRVTLEVSSSVIYKDGAPFAIQGIARDITERKRAEAALKEREEQYRDLFENANDLIYTRDMNGKFTSLNRAGEIISGYTREEAYNLSFDDLIAPDYVEKAAQIRSRLLAGEQNVAYELEIFSKQGRRVTLELNTRLMMQNNVPVAVQGIARDITERKRAQEILVGSERRYRALGEGIMHQVWTAQPDGKLDYVNGRTTSYFGRSHELLTGEGWQDLVHPDDLPESLERWTRSLADGEDYETEFRLRRHDGEYRWHQARATAGRGEDGEIVNWFGTNTDIHNQKIAEAKLNFIAGHDTLTNLPNRPKFMNHLTRAISRSEHNSTFRFAVLFLDLDRFKVINDSLGHTTGDKLLIALAKRLEECLRPNDIVARLGGDEFTVLLYNIGETADAARVADRILEKLSVPFNLDSYEVFTSASIGIIISDEVRRQPEDFLRDADTAMYRAKAAGKSRYEIFDREMHLRNMNLLQLENDLRRAIGQNEFRVFYQPIVELETGEIREFEALIRWQHPQHGLVAPNDFIGIAEETGLIIPIGRWILEEAARQTVEWHEQFPLHENLSISVNLSAKQLMHPKLTAQVGDILEKTRLDSRHLKLEVTESMVMENSEYALKVIVELNKIGVQLSTDDFGTGYSSLSYLHRFPFNRLKIDRSFVSKMDSDQKSEAIVRTILLLAQNLNIEVVAEGIETESQLKTLQNLGCRTGQGYLFSKPVTAEAAAQLLRNGAPEDDKAPFYKFGNKRNHPLPELEKAQ